MPRKINYPGYQTGGSTGPGGSDLLEWFKALQGSIVGPGGVPLDDDQAMEWAIKLSQREFDPNLSLARPERGLLPDFSQDPELGRLRDKMGIKPRSAVMRQGFKGLKGLLMAGGATALGPASALADVMMSPQGLGPGDLPERDPLSDEDKMRYYDELMGQGADLMPSRDYFSDEEPEDREGILRRLFGGWDNRLRGEEEAREQHEARERLEEFLGRGRASGGIIGLQTGGPAPTMSRVTSYGVPQQTAQQWANLTDRIVNEGQRPYQQYGGQRLAGFTQPEAAAMAGQVAYGQGMGPMGTRQAAQTFGQAGQMIGGAQRGLMGLQPQYAQTAAQFGAAAPLAQQQAQQAARGMGQLGARAEFQGQLAGAGMRGTGTAGQTRQDLLGAGQATAGKTALAAQQQFAGGLPSEGGLGGIVGMGATAQEKAGTGAGTMREIGGEMAAPEMQRQANLQDYMSQYTSGVTDPQLQQLMEFQRMQGQELGSQAAQSGAFGGLRQGVQAATQARDVSQQAAEIIGKGQQEAFESAQQAFQADRAAQAAGRGQQLTAEQQASAQEQQGLQAQMAAQQEAARMGDVGAARQLQGLQAQQAAEQAGVGMSQLGQQQGFQAAQAGTQLGLGGLQAAQGARQAGWGTYGQMLGQQQGAIGAQGQLYGQMGGMGGQLAGLGGQQMQLGAQQQQQQLERLRGMEAAGEKQRQMQQQSLGMGYQDWQNRLDQERANIGWQQAAMSGLPYKGTDTQSLYQPQTGPGASALATGVGALGLYNQYQQGQQGAMPGSSSGSWQGGRPESFTSGPLYGNEGATPWSTQGGQAGAGAGAGTGWQDWKPPTSYAWND